MAKVERGKYSGKLVESIELARRSRWPRPSISISARRAAEFHGDKEQRIFLQADKTVEYGDIMAVMNALRNSGYLKIALVGLEAPDHK